VATAATATKSKLLRYFDTAAAAQSPHPTFAAAAPDAVPFTHHDALADQTGALTVNSYELCPAELANFIRAGLLTLVGFAMSRTQLDLANALSKTKLVEAFLSDVGNELKNPLAPPPLAELNDFLMALSGTILPCLIDRPQAMSTWLALTRTVLVLNKKNGWPLARDYLDQFLNRQVQLRAPFSIFNYEIITSIQYGASGARSAQQSPGSGGGGSGSGDSGARKAARKKEICRAFNGGGCAPICPSGRKHKCQTCGSKEHGLVACKAK
jgi:hypothetical protein